MQTIGIVQQNQVHQNYGALVVLKVGFSGGIDPFIDTLEKRIKSFINLGDHLFY